MSNCATEHTDSLFGNSLVSSYSRAEAIADGVLIDVSAIAKETGIRYPVALTQEVHARYVALTPMAKRMGNDEDGRLWDVLWMFRCAALQTSSSVLTFEAFVVTDRRKPSRVALKAVCGPGDDGEPVITITLPEED